MSRAARKVLTICHAAGIFKLIDYLTVERTYAGRNQKAQGWATWVGKTESGLFIVWSCEPIADLHVGEVDYMHERHGMGVVELFSRSRRTPGKGTTP